MGTHTPGPWKLENNNGTRYIRAADGTALMCEETYYPWCPDSDADWRLIAAAPELYALARQAVENRGCADPDCCPEARKHTAALDALKTLLAQVDGVDGGASGDAGDLHARKY